MITCEQSITHKRSKREEEEAFHMWNIIGQINLVILISAARPNSVNNITR